jgi:hypothetical protein
MRRSIAMLGVSVLVGALVVPGAAPASPTAGDPAQIKREALKDGFQIAAKTGSATKAPSGPNPYLALLADPATADYSGWNKWLAGRGAERAAAMAQQRASLRAAVAPPLEVVEQEPAGTNGANDSRATGEQIRRFGTAKGKNPKAHVTGTLSPEAVETVAIPPNAEDDGAIPLAVDTGISPTVGGITTTGTVGDGPHGSTGTGTGDFDYYKVAARAGETLVVDIDTPTGPLDSYVIVYDSTGEEVARNDDTDGFDSFVAFPVTASGDYFVMVAGFLSLPGDPFDPASGTGFDSEGPYNIKITVGTADVDFYAVFLRRGDVLGASLSGEAAFITVFDRHGVNVHGSNQDASFIYSANTPLPGGGNAVTDHVTDEDGWHYLAITDGAGEYEITVEAYRPGLEGGNKVQNLFLDFDGARLNTSIFGGPGVRTLSPMRDFLPAWGLTAADENAVIDQVVATVTENIRRDLRNSGLNKKFDVRILNSRDHRDTFGQPNVSRLIVGGTVEESGIATIGIAQSIDVGNFDPNESALILLDLLSAPVGDDASLNTYVTPASDKVAFVGRAVGNVASHEAGHFFGDFHVEQFNTDANLMDQGGNFPLLFAVGPDNVGGTADDPDVDFGEDVFNPNEGFTGIEDTGTRLTFVLTK